MDSMHAPPADANPSHYTGQHSMMAMGSQMTTGGMSANMQMVFFHSASNFKVLFDVWAVNEPWQFLLTLLGCFVMGFVYETLRLFRQFHFERRGRNMPFSDVVKMTAVSKYWQDSSSPSRTTSVVVIGGVSTAEMATVGQNVNAVSAPPVTPPRQNGAAVATSIFSCFHILQTIMHMINVTLSFLLMLVVMSFNVWILLTVVIGITVSYFTFSHFLNSTAGEDDNCCS